MQKVETNIVNWIKEKISNAGAKGGIIGLSGGIDSAVAAALLKKAYPEKCLGLIMPCHSSSDDIEDGHLTAQYLDMNSLEVDLSSVYDAMLATFNHSEKDNNLIAANIKPRLRMTTLYYYGALNNYLVIGTSNKSEILTGYFTKYGDAGVDIEPIGNLYKTQVYQLAKHLGIPEVIIKKAPSAGLWDNQTDEEEMGLTYEELDKYLSDKSGTEKIANIVNKLRSNSEHKRHLPPIPNN